MKNLFISLLVLSCISNTYAQIGIKANGSAPITSAQLEVQSTTKAFYPPRMNTAQKNAIAGVAAGAVVFDTDLGALNYYTGSAWVVGGSGITLPYISSGIDVAQIYGLFRISELNTVAGGSAIQGFSTNGSGLIGNSSNYRGVYGYSNNGTAGYFNSPSGYALTTGTGNVGIGTATPQTKLHVALGNVRVDALAGSGNTQLYADNQGTISGQLPVAFSVKNTNGLIALANAVLTTFPFSTETYDLGGFFDNTNYEFNAPTNGIYHFDCFITFGVVNSAFSTSTYELDIKVDNLTLYANNQPLEVSGYKTLNLSHDIKLNAGQRVKIVVIQNSGNAINMIGTLSSNFSGHLVVKL